MLEKSSCLVIGFYDAVRMSSVFVVNRNINSFATSFSIK